MKTTNCPKCGQKVSFSYDIPRFRSGKERYFDPPEKRWARTKEYPGFKEVQTYKLHECSYVLQSNEGTCIGK